MEFDWPVALAWGLGAYLLGSIPTAYIVVRMHQGSDIRRLGSGNVGATNTFQQAGALPGFLVLLADTGKGVLAVLAPIFAEAPHWTIFITSTMALAGHNWPVFLKFHGGKGVGVILGVSLWLVPWLTLVTLAPAVLVILKLRNVTTGATLGFGMLNILILATRAAGGLGGAVPVPHPPGFGHLFHEHPPSGSPCRQDKALEGPVP